MKILNVVAARPNMMKVAPVHEAFVQRGHEAILVHTGQHYDANMSKIFFEQLGMPRPDEDLGVGSHSQAVQTARVMERFEAAVLRHEPDMVLVAGDVNSTMACALVATKLHISVAHLEAGLRSFDRRMPEEINRLVTDAISDILLTPSPDGDDNLRAEGVPAHKIVRVGNAMIDSLRRHLEAARALPILDVFRVAPKEYALLTLHRPSNVDDPATLTALIGAVARVSSQLPVLFPVHPRTRARISESGLDDTIKKSRIRLLGPQGYLEFLALQAQATMVLTDSGGIQEETTALGVPCLTLRENTERPVTVSQGTNTVVGTDPEVICKEAELIVATGGKTGRIPELWDGGTGPRVVDAIEKAHAK